MEIIKNSTLKENIDDIKIGATNLSDELENREIIGIGSQILYGSISGTGAAAKTALLGAYDYDLIRGIFANITIPTGWHREYRITFQGTTSGNGLLHVYLNNIASSFIQTWSADSFRAIGGTPLFKESDITLEATMHYTRDGCNLYYDCDTTASGVNWTIWNITVHGYLVKD